MDIFTDYVEQIRKAMTSDKRGKPISEMLNGPGNHNTSFDIPNFLSKASRIEPLGSLQSLSTSLGIQPVYEQKLGLHPDFAYLKDSEQTERHYITSVFMDIKGSTNLFKRYNPETVWIITKTIQQAAIHIALIFRGYVQRLHGDGLFVYFGGKNEMQQDAVNRALKSASIFSYFVKNDLKNVFNEQGVETIYTRTGIDHGDADVVLWAKAGIGEISEVTTCSLHTSLASKMQSSAENNGIVTGQNVLDLSTPRYFSVVSTRTRDEKDRYIFRDQERNRNYTQYDFAWMQYLKDQEFIATDMSGNLSIKDRRGKTRDLENLRPIAQRNTPYLP